MARKKKDTEITLRSPTGRVVSRDYRDAKIELSDIQLRPEPKGTPLPETEYERYLEARVQKLEAELQQRHLLIEGLIDRLGDNVSRKYGGRYGTDPYD